MKAKLEFDLEDYSDQLSHRRAISATDAYLVLHDLDNMLREYTKYSKNISEGSEIALPEGYHKITEIESVLLHGLADTIRMKFGEIKEKYNINMDDLE